MTRQLVHRPARSTRPLTPAPPRSIEPPPNLPEGKLGNAATVVGRVHTSLAGEVKRRQQVLKDAGSVADIGHYAALRATERPDLEPLPHLFVVIDEFGELITEAP